MFNFVYHNKSASQIGLGKLRCLRCFKDVFRERHSSILSRLYPISKAWPRLDTGKHRTGALTKHLTAVRESWDAAARSPDEHGYWALKATRRGDIQAYGKSLSKTSAVQMNKLQIIPRESRDV